MRDDSRHLDDIFRPEFFGLRDGFRAAVRVDDDLRDAVTVAEVEKHPRPVIAAGIDPATQGDGLADMFGPQLAAGMGTQHARTPQEKRGNVIERNILF
jgi:hypothetical protein